jgi:hypothetical protein
MTSGVVVSKDRVHIRGQGVHGTTVRYAPPIEGSTAFTFAKSPIDILFQCGLSELAIQADSVNTAGKTAIKIVDTSSFKLLNVAILYFSGTGGDSIGVHTMGREQNSFIGLRSSADLPLVIDTNPNPAVATIVEDADHFHFSDLLLDATGSNPCVKIMGGVALSGVTFDGFQAWVTGGNGLSWISTTSRAPSSNLCIRNLRREQATSNGYGIYIDLGTSSSLQNLQLDNCRFSTTSRNGIFLRGVRYSTLINVTALAGVALNMDASTYLDQCVTMLGCMWQRGTTANMTNLKEKWGISKQYTDMPLPSTAFYSYWNP